MNSFDLDIFLHIGLLRDSNIAHQSYANIIIYVTIIEYEKAGKSNLEKVSRPKV